MTFSFIDFNPKKVFSFWCNMVDPDFQQKHKLNRIINEIDPIRLIAMGVPLDEYSIEVNEFFVRWDGIVDKDKMVNTIYNIFDESFSPILMANKETYVSIIERFIES